MLHLSQKIDEKLKNSTVFLDTNVFIMGARFPELIELLEKFRSSNKCVFVTLSSVLFEYTRGSKDIKELNTRRDFINSIVYIVNTVGRLLESEKNDVFSVIMSTLLGKKDSQYTDYLLATALHQYSFSPDPTYVLTADSKGFPWQIFDLEGLISVGREAKILNLYSLNPDNYSSVAQSILSSGSLKEESEIPF